jgi:hypothetical protein
MFTAMQRCLLTIDCTYFQCGRLILLMSVERPQKHSKIVTDPEMVFALKEELMSAWNQLPHEHQETMILTLIKEVQKGEWGESLAETIAQLTEKEKEKETGEPIFPVYSLGRTNLERAFSEEEITQLGNQDIKRIAEEVRDGFLFDSGFWFAVKMIGQHILEERG